MLIGMPESEPFSGPEGGLYLTETIQAKGQEGGSSKEL